MKNACLSLIAAAALLVGAACGTNSGGPPAIEVDRTPCAHCGMLISEPVYAAAYRTAGGDAAVFDDIACMLASARRAGVSSSAQFWFHDAATGNWIDGDEALFVKSPNIRTPMAGGMLAYREPSAANRAAADHRGELIETLQDLLATKGER